MQVTYELNPGELTPSLLESLRALFPNQRVRITVQKSDPADETDYLLQSEANRASLLAGLEDLQEGRVVHFSSIEDLEKSLLGHG